MLSLLLLAAPAAAAAASGTLKVFVLAGQSNMEGHAEVGTLDPESGRPKNGTLKYQLTDPRTAEEFAPTWDKTAGKSGSMRRWAASSKARTVGVS